MSIAILRYKHQLEMYVSATHVRTSKSLSDVELCDSSLQNQIISVVTTVVDLVCTPDLASGPLLMGHAAPNVASCRRLLVRFVYLKIILR